MTDPQQAIHEKLLIAVDRHAMLAPGDRVLVALSGGQDSLALLHALHALRDRLDITLHAGHLHHGMRGEAADADLKFLEELCAGLGVPLWSRRVSVGELAGERGISLEEAGRDARHEFLRDAATAHRCARIALGHTATDRAETVLMNILRGAGLDGLRGIRPVRDELIRPLISVTREETAAYCEAVGLEPRLDSTNLDTDAYLRNRIRLKLLPLIRAEYAGGVDGALLRLADAADQELAWTEAAVTKAFATATEESAAPTVLRLDALLALPEGLLRRVLRSAVRQVAGTLRGLTMRHVADLAELVRAGRVGAQVHLPFEVYAERGYNDVSLVRGRPAERQAVAWCVSLPVPGAVGLPHGGTLTATLRPRPADPRLLPNHEAVLDVAASGDALVVRGWRPGDRIRPLGMTGARKLQDVFGDAKVPRRERATVPVVVNSAGVVLWIAGLRLSRLAAVAPNARRCVHLVWEPGGGRDEGASMCSPEPPGSTPNHNQ